MNYLMNNNLTFNGQAKGTWTQLRLEQNWNINKWERILKCKELLLKNKDKVKFNNQNYWMQCFIYESFYYFDPPYFANKGKPHKHKFTHNDWTSFKFFIDYLNDRGQLFLISLDNCSEIKEMFKDYIIVEKEWKYTSSNTKGNKICKTGKELFIKNY
ncbi:DNA adenine methylase [Mesoplasma melaleucae]|nr:DNA adenine methylase [Mesoplasma melaleucae]